MVLRLKNATKHARHPKPAQALSRQQFRNMITSNRLVALWSSQLFQIEQIASCAAITYSPQVEWTTYGFNVTENTGADGIFKTLTCIWTVDATFTRGIQCEGIQVIAFTASFELVRTPSQYMAQAPEEAMFDDFSENYEQEHSSFRTTMKSTLPLQLSGFVPLF